MDASQIEQARDLLIQQMDNQLAVDKAAANTNQRLGQQQIMYNNDARGTLYSGQPTWERAQLAATGTSNLSKLGTNYLKQKLDIWNNVTSNLDQIQYYNQAAADMNQSAAKISGAA